MKMSLVIRSIVFLVFVKVAYSRHGNNTEDRIVGGYNIGIEKVPYQVYMDIELADGYYTMCGGSIISEKWVLTAAHCLDDIRKLYVVIGATDLKSGEALEYLTTSYIQHPHYSEKTLDYDVGLVFVKEGMKLDGVKAKIIRIASEGTALAIDTELLLTGYGHLKEGAMEGSRHLKALNAPVIAPQECRNVYTTFTARNFCAGFLEGLKDTCQGDSGGPAVSTETGIQVGIVSYGYGCARKGYPGVYTAVANHEIHEYIKKHLGV